MRRNAVSGRDLSDVLPRKVLVIKPSALGDVVHGLTFLHAITDRFPDAEVHWVVARGLDGILQDNPKISRLWIIDKDRWKRLDSVGETLRALWGLGRDLRAERFDWVVDLQGLFRSGLIAGLTRCPVRIGFREGREGSPFFYTHRVRGGRDVHAIDRYLEIARFLGCSADPVRHAFSPPVESPLLATLPEQYVVMAPSAGGEAKKWPAERFGELASRLPWTSLVVAGRADAGLASVVVDHSAGRAVSLAGRTSLRELVEIIRRAKWLISNDTGPMHIAAGLNVPVLALFGPTSPDRTGPYGEMHTIVRSSLPCSPCFKRGKCAQWRCMEGILVEQVLSVMESAQDRIERRSG